jgi:hypothetical protein
MHPVHPDFQSVVVAEHVESLRPPPARPENRLRRRAGRWLVAAGLRLAPELEPNAARASRPRAPALGERIQACSRAPLTARERA